MVEEVVQFDGATKEYGIKSIGPITFSVGRGDTVGFLGPNGAGKSTSIRMLLGLIRPTAGSVRLMGIDPLRHHVRALEGVGYSPELPNLQSFLTPRELLQLTARELGMNRRETESQVPLLLERVGLIEYQDYRIAKLSKGMVQRLSVAQAMVGSPRLLILDEPMIGIDPAGVVHFRSLFRDFVKDGRGTIIMSSHILSEVELLCTSLAVVHSGKLIFRGNLGEFVRSQLNARVISAEIEGADDSLIRAIAAINGVLRATATASGVIVEVASTTDPRADISRTIVQSGARLLSIGYARSELDQAYMTSMRGGHS